MSHIMNIVTEGWPNDLDGIARDTFRMLMMISFSKLPNKKRIHPVWQTPKSGLGVLQMIPDSKVHGANMGSIWGRQDPGGPYVGPMNLAIWDGFQTNRAINSNPIYPSNIDAAGTTNTCAYFMRCDACIHNSYYWRQRVALLVHMSPYRNKSPGYHNGIVYSYMACSICCACTIDSQY